MRQGARLPPHHQFGPCCGLKRDAFVKRQQQCRLDAIDHPSGCGQSLVLDLFASCPASRKLPRRIAKPFGLRTGLFRRGTRSRIRAYKPNRMGHRIIVRRPIENPNFLGRRGHNATPGQQNIKRTRRPNQPWKPLRAAAFWHKTQPNLGIA